MADNVNKPKHYMSPNPVEARDKVGNIFDAYLQALDVIKAWELNFNLGQIIKYVLRSGKKGDNPQLWIEDLKKARFYLDDEIKQCEKKYPVKHESPL